MKQLTLKQSIKTKGIAYHWEQKNTGQRGTRDYLIGTVDNKIVGSWPRTSLTRLEKGKYSNEENEKIARNIIKLVYN